MLPTDHLLAFGLASFVIIVVPGPGVLFVVSRTLTLGRGAGLATVLGHASGVYLQVLAVAAGLGPLVQASVAVFTAVKLAGAAYLVFLGAQAIRHRRALGDALRGAEQQPRATARVLADAFVVGIANPKAIVFFAAILPQFVDRSAGHVPGQLLVLGALFVAIALICDSAWAMAASRARTWLTRSPQRLELIGGAGGLAMAAIGARLALTGRKD